MNKYTFYLDSCLWSRRGKLRIKTRKVEVVSATVGAARDLVKKTYPDLAISMFWLDWPRQLLTSKGEV